jgi:hypothetical protein
MSYLEQFLVWNWEHPDASFAGHYMALIALFVFLIAACNIWQRVKEVIGWK